MVIAFCETDLYLICLACCLGFDVREFSEDGSDDVEGMDASAAHVANLLSTEPANSMSTRLFYFPKYLISLFS